MGTIEHRKLFRAKALLEISFETLAELPKKGLFLSNDLSSSGMSVISNQKFDMGVELRVQIPIEERSDPVITVGKVIWQKQCQYIPQSQHLYYAVGLRFLEMSPQDAIDTSDFIYKLVKFGHDVEEKEIINIFEKLGK